MSKQKSLTVLQEGKEPWYQEGVKFKCTGCGQCCTGAPGVVWVSDEEVELLSKHLLLSVEKFCQKYTRLINGRRSLNELPKTYDCVFLKDNRCSVYECRPVQCKTFPWWPHQLKSLSAWNNASKWCEGINHPDADCVDVNQIEASLIEYTETCVSN